MNDSLFNNFLANHSSYKQDREHDCLAKMFDIKCCNSA